MILLRQGRSEILGLLVIRNIIRINSEKLVENFVIDQN